MRVAYFTSEYPAVSHTFIRREIKALEALGVTVFRFALRASPAQLVDADDQAELRQTRLILSGEGFFAAVFHALTRQFVATVRMLRLAVGVGMRSRGGVLRYLAYAAEAIVLAHWCRRERIEHVHAHFATNPTAVAMLTGCLTGLTYSFTVHGDYETAPFLALDEKLRRSAFAVCVSSFGRGQLMRWSRPDQWAKIAVIRCGVDRAFLDRPVPETAAAPRLVCVGRLVAEKGQLVLIAAARRLSELGHEFELVLAGDGPMRGVIEAAVAEARLERHVSITGWISGEQVRAEIAHARALVLPSFSENLPIVIMEAMALGRPVIATYIAGIPELVEPGRTGWLVPASDADALAEAMREALMAPAARLAAMGAAGRARIVEHYDVAAGAAELKRLFERIDRKPMHNP